MSANVDQMVYPILFPRGDPEWHQNLRHVVERATAARNRTTMLQYYSYRLSARRIFIPILESKKLLQQYAVDAYCKTEAQRLDFQRRNQNDCVLNAIKAF